MWRCFLSAPAIRIALIVADDVTGRRTLRSGKEFPQFDLAAPSHVSPISAPDFDVADKLASCIASQEATGQLNKLEELKASFSPTVISSPSLSPLPSTSSSSLFTPPFWVNPTPDYSVPSPFHPVSAPSAPSAPSASTSSNDRTLSNDRWKKEKSKERRNRRREAEQEKNSTPGLKGMQKKCREEALRNAIHLDVDTSDLSHSKPAWIGSRSAETDYDNGMGGRIYTREEVRELTGTDGLRYINWLGVLSIPILDSRGRIIAVLGGMPRDHEGWKKLIDELSILMDEASPDLQLRPRTFTIDAPRSLILQYLEVFPSAAAKLNLAAFSITSPTPGSQTAFSKIFDFNDSQNGPIVMLFFLFAPLLAAFYQSQMDDLTLWKPSLVWNFVGSIFAACTFNFGPHTITLPHLDFGNLSWGWCAITALGWFDPDFGGHLILWDLKLVIRFLPRSTILIPSAIIRHSNVPICPHEKRFSFTQYTVGGLFRWIRNGFQTDVAFENTATKEEKRERAEEAKTRWEKGVAMYSTVDSLRT
ncbi:hypothetical protein B0H16DRAFT_1822025 [Mycena metata]|uniref:Uncharacterized protein n=1 Tax=Mycena metata TaxID=1033252 RepID=A0AAD7H0X8_9AGAR|nr:hypothetical protein B0H16DRAFT_1822025 [Mycena metata]